MMFEPKDADIGGAPRAWLRGSRSDLNISQPVGSVKQTIPFDKCTAVLEYDSRNMVLPQNNGWIPMVGLGWAPVSEWSLENGALKLSHVIGAGVAMSKQSAVRPIGSTLRLYSYASMLGDDIFQYDNAPALGVGDGLLVRALIGISTLNMWTGLQCNIREDMAAYTQLAPSMQNPLADIPVMGYPLSHPPGWVGLGAAVMSSNPQIGFKVPIGYASTVTQDFASRLYYLKSGVWTAFNFETIVAGSDGTPNPATNSLILVIGASPASTLTGYYRDIVAADGRWIRARFTGYTQVRTPVMRLYLSAEVGSIYKTARFKVKYGPSTGDPNVPPALSAAVTASLQIVNMTYEVPISLPGLVANTPFWFSIERDWEHADDKLDATVHLLHGTIRAL